MALKYWHAIETNSDEHDIARDLFFRTDDAVTTDAAVRANFVLGTLFQGDDNALINPRALQNLQPATVEQYDEWHSRKVV